eukprot:maker-scaffold872_size86337-snap-gene-0.15 protein:Tk06109 transcript:maker-scaffold872_size86337-snap-gene-0.15-mRNA-1 annotation:"probable elongator complex protein 3-like"
MGRKVKDSGLSREERMVQCIGDIIQELIQAHDQRKDVNLNRCKTRISSKYALDSSPRLVDIIAGVPHEYKKILLPKLRAKPVRTASGVELIRRDYYANEGWETFLSYEDPTQDILVGLLRLRKPSEDVFRAAFIASSWKHLHKRKLCFFPGVGTRNYYRKLGYELDGPYMSKEIL